MDYEEMLKMLEVPENNPMNRIYKITLDDGTIIGDLKLNGNNFVSKTEVDPAIFDGKLSTVEIDNGEYVDHHENMQLVQVTKEGDEWWFVLIDIPKEQIEKEKLRADVDFLAMMTDVEI